MASAGPGQPRRSLFRRWILPLAPVVLIGLVVCAHLLVLIWDNADWNVQYLNVAKMTAMNLTFLTPVLLLIWLLVFPGFRWRTKGLVLGVAAIVVVGLLAAIQEVRVTGNLGGVFYFRWQTTPEQALARHQAREASDDSSVDPIDVTIDPNDSYPRYRGPRVDGVIRGLKLDPDWKNHPPKEIWRHPVGRGFSGFAVAGNVLVTMEQRDDQEAVVCYDRATGRQRWIHAYPASFRDPTGNGPRATPTIDGTDVFSLGATGQLTCVDACTGKLRWETDILADNGAKRVIWGMTSSPLVLGNQVLVNAGIDPANNQNQALAAYDRATKAERRKLWAVGSAPAGYSSAQLVTLAGREQVLLFDAGGLAGFDPKGGGELWRYPWTTFQDMNIIQPLVLEGDRVFIASEASNGGAMLQISATAKGFDVKQVWANHSLGSKYANPVSDGSSIYGLSVGWLVCLDAETGERRWRGKYYGHGQVLLVGEHLLVQGENGTLALVAARTDRFEELGRIKPFEDRTWNTLALAGRRLYLRNDVEMVCYELAGSR
jgi:outer membrane protein assembly factor BamB